MPTGKPNPEPRPPVRPFDPECTGKKARRAKLGRGSDRATIKLAPDGLPDPRKDARRYHPMNRPYKGNAKLMLFRLTSEYLLEDIRTGRPALDLVIDGIVKKLQDGDPALIGKFMDRGEGVVKQEVDMTSAGEKMPSDVVYLPANGRDEGT